MAVEVVEGKGQLWRVNLGHPIVTNGDFATRLFPNYFGWNLLIFGAALNNAICPAFCTDVVEKRERTCESTN